MKRRTLLTLDEVANYLHIDRDEVTQLIDRHELDAVDLPRGIIRVRPVDLEAFVRTHRRRFTFRPVK